MSNEVATTTASKAVREYAPVRSTNIIMDSAFYDHIYRIANLMAVSGMMPESLAKYKGKTEDGREAMLDLPDQMVLARAFMIAEVSARFDESPFTLMQHVSFVRGKFMWEGKIVHAILEKNFGISLSYEYGTWDAKREKCDLTKGEGEGDMLAIKVSGEVDGRICEAHGNVGSWKTTRADSPWRTGAMRRMLSFRGAREFMRMHKPAALLGIITDDEELPPQTIEQPRRKVSERLAGKKGNEGFSIEHIQREMGDEVVTVDETASNSDMVAQAAQEVADDSIPGEEVGLKPLPRSSGGETADEVEEKPTTEQPSDFIKGAAVNTEVVEQESPQPEAEIETKESATIADLPSETVVENDASPSDAFDAFNAGIDAANTWAEIDGAFMTLFATDEWKAAEEWERRAVRVTIWECVVALREKTKAIIVDPRDNAKAFLCWLDCAKTGDEKQVDLLFSKLQATPTYKKFNDAQRAHIEAQVAETLKRIGKK